ncbi:MAG: hypothetical protein ABL918_04895 [Chakrabartia sp.]
MVVKHFLRVALSMAALLSTAAPAQQVITANELRTLPKIAEVDERFQSFNVEMVEVTGGRFWASYDDPAGARYAQRPPIDLTNKRLNVLAAGLAPAYMRVSGTWANSTYVPRVGEAPLSTPPTGFQQLLTYAQWRNVVGFSRKNRLAIITSFPVSAGTRGADGRWSPDQAQRLLDLTQHFDGKIVAAEFFNEPNLTKLGRLPDGYNLSDYGRDFGIFTAFAKKAAPNMLILGPGSSGKGGDLTASDMMRVGAGVVDAVSYHFYGALSKRCTDSQTTADEALSEEWLSRTERDHDFYAGLRDQYEPGKDMWLTETAQAACGGSPWATTFRDTFRYVDQMGRLARRGVKVVAHNTLAASEYALIDGKTLEPRPSYWAALLWRRIMGKTVLERPITSAPGLMLYVHCLRGNRNGVALLVENLGSEVRTISLPKSAKAYVITASTLDARTVAINGREPTIAGNGALPHIAPRQSHGSVSLPLHSISFLTMTDIANPACALE